MARRKRRILVERPFVGGPERRGEVLETLGEPPHLRYRVRWDDGRESIVYPGSDARIETRGAEPRRRPQARAAPKGAGPEPEAAELALRASAGDRLVIRSHHLGEPQRDAEILEVLGKAGGPPYRVRWEDESHESIVFPGADAFVEHFARRAEAVSSGQEEEGGGQA